MKNGGGVFTDQCAELLLDAASAVEDLTARVLKYSERVASQEGGAKPDESQTEHVPAQEQSE
jgi:hypothetical protein